MRKVLVLLAIVLVAGAVTARADVINPINTRPVTVGTTTDTQTPCWAGGAANCELQTLVNYLNPGSSINVNTDQQVAGMWALGGASPTAEPVLGLEIAGDNTRTTTGIWSVAADGTETLVPIFLPSATGTNDGKFTKASLDFDTTTGTLEISPGNSYSAGLVNQGTFLGINPNAFGFYIYDGAADQQGRTFFSVDSLNPENSPQMLAFRDTNPNRWTLCFEDTLYGASDKDFNDVMFQIESITPVPEPGSMLLLGTGLFGLAGAIRRRIKK